MRRFAALFCAVGLWALPAAAQPQLDHPTVAVGNQRCTTQQRARCEGVVGQRAAVNDPWCDVCIPMPADVVAPSSPTPTQRTKTPECLPRADHSLPSICAEAPRLDHIPKP